MLRKSNILDKIGAIIPGYRGYAARDEKRKTDQKLRGQLAITLQTVEKSITEKQKDLIKSNELRLSQEWELTRKSVDTLASRIKNATYGNSSFFSENELKQGELETIYQKDLQILERVNLIQKTINGEINEAMSAGFITQQLKEIDRLIIERTNFINQFK